MTKSEARQVAAILNAWADGETIQICRHDSVWWPTNLQPADLTDLVTGRAEFRIKPKPREWWIVGIESENENYVIFHERDPAISCATDREKATWPWPHSVTHVREVTDDE